MSRHVHPALDNLYRELWKLYFSVVRDEAGPVQAGHPADRTPLPERREETSRPSPRERTCVNAPETSSQRRRGSKKPRTVQKETERFHEQGESPLGRELRSYYEQLWCRDYPQENGDFDDGLEPSEDVLSEERRRRKKEKKRMRKQAERDKHRGMQIGLECPGKPSDAAGEIGGREEEEEDEALSPETAEKRTRRKEARGYRDAPVISNPASLSFCVSAPLSWREDACVYVKVPLRNSGDSGVAPTQQRKEHSES